jgi:hypothetical protein
VYRLTKWSLALQDCTFIHYLTNGTIKMAAASDKNEQNVISHLRSKASSPA